MLDADLCKCERGLQFLGCLLSFFLGLILQGWPLLEGFTIVLSLLHL